MVAIVAGGGLGLNTSSLAVLGSAGAVGSAALGRGAERVYVNAATGNLVIQGNDEVLAGRGPDAFGLRTYNSLGQWTDDSDNWLPGLARRVWLSAGAANTAGSTATRRDEDGNERVFAWNASKGAYLSSDGAGAHDSLGFNVTTGVWTYTDGSTRVLESYGSGGRLVGVADAVGNSLTVGYNPAGLVSSVTTAGGEVSYYDYDPSNRLEQIRTVTKSTASGSPDQTLTRVRYGYDSSSRLITVTVDLSPEDNLVTDGRVFSTTYTYEGSSRRVSTLRQSDGVSLTFTYEATSQRLKTVVDALGASTTFDYDTANRRTTVTDAMNRVTALTYDAKGQLTMLEAPAVGTAAPQQVSFEYDAATGDVKSATDASGKKVNYGYDANGNQTTQADAAGNKVVRSYSTANQLQTETVAFAGTATGNEAASRYVYDAAGKGLLRFIVSPEGRVTENRYDAQGQLMSSLQYAAAQYVVAGLASNAVPTESAMVTWAAAQDKTRIERQDFQYDWRGQLKRSTRYATTTAAGDGVADGTHAVTQYAYDPYGLLLQSVSATEGVTQYVYDGLGRVITVRDAVGRLTTTSYDDANNRVQVTQSSGLVTTTSYDKAGRLTAVVQGSLASSPWLTSGEVALLGGEVTKSGATGWNAAVRSSWGVSGNVSLSFQPRQVDKGFMAGLNSDPATDSSYSSIDWAFYCKDNGLLYVYENGVNIGQFGAYAAGDNLTVSYDGSTVRYTRNGEVLRSVTVALAQPLYADSSFYTSGVQVGGLRMEAPSSGAPFVNDGGISVSGGTATKTGGTDGSWDSALHSRQGYVGGASVSFKPAQNNAYLMVGLNTDPTADKSYSSLDWAWYCYGNGTLYIYEDGANVGQFGSYAAGDSLSVTYDGSTVRYLRNGVVMRSVAATISQPLFADTSFRSSGARITQLEFTPAVSVAISQRSYDAQGQLRMTQDAVGARSWFLYDEAGRQVGTVDAFGGLTEYVYNANNQVTHTIAYATPVPVSSLVDAAGQPSVATLASLRPAASTADRKTWTAYDSANRLSKTVSALGEVTEYGYDASGRLISQRTYANAITTTGLSASPAPSAIAPVSSGADRLQRNFYGADGLLIATLDGAGGLVEYQYDAAGRQTQRLTRVNVANPTYAQSGTLAQLRPADAAGDERTLSFYDASGRLVAQLDGENFLTERSYDLDGNLRAMHRYPVRSATGQTANSNLASLRSGAGTAQQTVAYAYDAVGRTLTETVDPAGLALATRYSYDDARNRVDATDAKGTVTRTQYDSRGLASVVTVDPGGLGLTTSHEYDAAGRLSQSTDPQGTVTRYAYDSLGRKTSVTVDPGGLALTTRFAYDAQGNLARMTDAKGQATRYVYDADNRLRYTQDAESGLTESRYDSLGNVVQTIRYANRQSAITTSDIGGGLVSNSLATISTDPSQDRVERSVYDPAGRLRFVIDPEGAVTEYRHDAAGKVLTTLRYERAMAMGGSLSEDVLEAATSLNELMDFATDTDGFTGTTANWEAGQLKLVSQPKVGGTNDTAEDTRRLLPGSAVKFDITLDQLQNDLYGGLEATAKTSGLSEHVRLLFRANGHVYAQVYGATVRGALTDLGTYAAGTTYTAEFLTDADGTSLLFYVKGQPRDSGASFQTHDLTWTQMRVRFWTRTYPDTPAVTTARVDNMTQKAPGALVERHLYDARGQLRYTIDPEGAVVEQQYDAAGQVVATLRYERTLAFNAAVTEDALQAATSLNELIDFAVDADGFTGTTANWEAGQLKLVSQPKPSGTNDTAEDSRRLAPGSSVKFDITPDQLQNDLYAGLEATAKTSGLSEHFRLLFRANGHVYAQVYGATVRGTLTDLGTYAAATTYTVEFLTDASGGTVYIYAKGQARNSAASMHTSDLTWTQLRVRFLARTYPDTPGVTTARVDNMTQKAPAAAQERYVRDAAGRLRFTIDPEGAVTERRYDAAGQVLTTLRYERTLAFTGALTEDMLEAAVSVNELIDFATDTDGFTGGTANWEAGQLKLVSQYKAGSSYDTAGDSRRLASGSSVKFDIKPDQLQNDLYAGLEATSTASGLSEYFRLLFRSNGHVYAQVYGATMRGALTDLGTYAAGTTYTAELLTDGDGGTLFLYVKGQSRSTGYEFATADLTWSQIRVRFWARTSSDVTSVTTARVDNIEEKAPLARQTRAVYDAAGRLVYQQDALGGVTEYRRDDAGKVIETIQYATRISIGTSATVAAFDAAVVVNAALDRPTRLVYDAAGQLRFTVDALGGVVEHVYDSLGNEARTIAYDTAVSYSAVSDSSTPQAVRALLPPSTLAARETIRTFDANGRVVHTAQSLHVSGSSKYFTVTERQYDALGRVTSEVAYATKVAMQDLAAVTTVAAVSAKLATIANPSTDRIEGYAYDRSGRLLQKVDGEGYAESYAYDAHGNRVSYVNRNGDRFDYAYDASGRLVSELSPEVVITALSEDTMAVSTLTQRIETQMRYDGLGNLVGRIEAANVNGQSRETLYEYDAVGRQVRTIFESAPVYDAAADSPSTNGKSGAAVVRTETTNVAIETWTSYNAFGEAVASRDVTGNHSYKTYDKLGRLVNEVDGNHNVTQHLYSSLDGDYTRIRRLSGVADFEDGLYLSQEVIDGAVSAAGSSGSRSVYSYLDKLGQVRGVYDLGDGVYSFDSVSDVGGTWTRATLYSYTVWGDVASKVTSLEGSSLGAGTPTARNAASYFLYDLQGGMTREIDAEGYVTDHARNSFGEDYQVTQYATRINVAAGLSTMPAALRASTQPTSAIGQDRITYFTYDRRGMKSSERVLDTLIGQRSDANALSNVAANIRTDYQYDGVGNTVRSTSKAYSLDWSTVLQSGDQSTNVYDVLGRLLFTADVAGRTTGFKRDAMGNAVVTTRYGNKATVTETAGSPYASYSLTQPAAHATDQITLQAFDRLGRVRRVKDAEGYDQFYSMDAAGRVVKQWKPFKDIDGNALNSIQYFSYDPAGRQTETRTLLQRDGASAVTHTTDTATYNAFGEITQKLRDGVQYAYFHYDLGGRVWRSNAEGGVDKVYLYDLQDNVTAVITSPTLDLKTYGTVQSVPTTLAAGVRRTANTYDRLRHLVEQSDLGVTHLGGTSSAQWVRQSYDAWGNVLGVTTSRGYTTNYRFNLRNQIIEDKKPTTTYYTDFKTQGDSYTSNDVAGTATTARPTTAIFYDAWGRNVGTRDARGKSSTATYTAAGQLEYEYHADGGVVQHVYDNFGREVQRTSAEYAATSNTGNGHIRYYQWDRLDRKTGETVYGRLLVHPDGANTAASSFSYTWSTYTLATYTYDALGNRIQEVSGADDKKGSVKRKYFFDTAGRMVKSTTPLQTVSYQYNAAGQKTGQTDALGQAISWTYSPQGQLSQHVDIGGATTRYTYDRTGALSTQTSDRGQSLGYTYYDDGRLKTIRDNWADTLSTYDYDADGNKTVDRFVTGASLATPTTYRNVTMGYDELGRMSSVVENANGTGNLADYTLSISYDANGNRYRVQGSTVDDDLYEDAEFSFYDPDNLSRRKVDLLFAYDGANRVIASRATDQSGTDAAPIDTYRWEYFGYDRDGNRITEEQRFANNGTSGVLTARLVDFKYDFAGRVTESFVTSKYSNGAGADTLGTRRYHRKNVFNAGSGFVQEWQWAHGYKVDSFAYQDLDPDRVFTTETWYDAAGAATSIYDKGKIGSGAWYGVSTQTSTYDAAGNLKTLSTQSYRDEANNLGSDLLYKYTYLEMEGYLQRTSTVTGSMWNGSSMAAATSVTTTQDYDVNGRLVQTYDNNTSNNSAEQYVVTDHAGHIVSKSRYRAGGAMAAHKATGTWDPASGVHGSTGGAAAPALPAAPAFTATLSSSVARQRIRYANDQMIGVTDQSKSMQKVKDPYEPGIYYYVDRYNTSTSVEEAFQGDNVQTSEGSGLQYTVNTGDTLRGLAQTFYGDAGLWYVIADANGYAGDETIDAGTILRIPSVTRSSNTATTFQTYDPGKIIGNTNPDPIAPPPPPPKSSGGGCGGLGSILVIVVAVVATVVTAGAAAVAMGASGGIWAAGTAVLTGAGGLGLSAAATVAAAAVGGAVGSIASQGVAIAMGMQDKFSWKSVGLGAIGAGVTAGLGQATSVFSAIGQATTPMVGVAAQAAVSNAVTQGIAVATGLQDKFDWRAVATSAIAAPLAQAAGATVGGAVAEKAGQFAGEFARRLTSGVVTQSVRMAVYGRGKLDFVAIAADAFGNALGDAIVAEAGKSDTSARMEALRKQVGSMDGEQLDQLAASLGDEFFAARSDRQLRLASNSNNLSLAGWFESLDAERRSVVAGVRDYLGGVKDGANELMTSALERLEQLTPGLGKALQTVAESLPEFYAAARQELKDAAPALIKDAVVTVGGMLLAEFTGGVSGAYAVTRAVQRGERIAEFAIGAYRAIRGATELISDLPGLIEDARNLVSRGVLGVVQQAAGIGGDSIESIAEKLGPGARALPGIGNEKIDRLLSDAMELGDRLLRAATNKFTKGSALLSAAANAVYRHGDVAERVTGFVLEHSGLFSTRSPGPGVPAMGPIQNRSGHGIDWVGRALTGRHAGDFVAFEIKGGLNGPARGLSGDQGSLQRFMQTRLQSAAAANGLWSGRNTSAGTGDFARYVQTEMTGRTWRGYLIQHNNMRTTPQVTWKPW